VAKACHQCLGIDGFGELMLLSLTLIKIATVDADADAAAAATTTTPTPTISYMAASGVAISIKCDHKLRQQHYAIPYMIHLA